MSSSSSSSLSSSYSSSSSSSSSSSWLSDPSSLDCDWRYFQPFGIVAEELKLVESAAWKIWTRRGRESRAKKQKLNQSELDTRLKRYRKRYRLTSAEKAVTRKRYKATRGPPREELKPGGPCRWSELQNGSLSSSELEKKRVVKLNYKQVANVLDMTYTHLQWLDESPWKPEHKKNKLTKNGCMIL